MGGGELDREVLRGVPLQVTKQNTPQKAVVWKRWKGSRWSTAGCVVDSREKDDWVSG